MDEVELHEAESENRSLIGLLILEIEKAIFMFDLDIP